jgi:hypothetical protein
VNSFLTLKIIININLHYFPPMCQCQKIKVTHEVMTSSPHWLLENGSHSGKRIGVVSTFVCLLSTLTIDINIYNYQIRLYACILCRLTKAFEHQYIIYVVTFCPPLEQSYSGTYIIPQNIHVSNSS